MNKHTSVPKIRSESHKTVMPSIRTENGDEKEVPKIVSRPPLVETTEVLETTGSGGTSKSI